MSRLWGAHERVLLAAQHIVDAPRPPQARLVATTGSSYELADREHVLGRAVESEIQIVDPAVSRRHARITPRDGGFVLQDLGSTSGTVVNGTRVTGERTLQRGDIIRLGDTELRYEI